MVYISKNNRINAEPGTPNDLDDDGEPEQTQDSDLEPNVREELNRGRQRILNTIRTLFLINTRCILFGDWNSLKDEIVHFMDEVGATRVPTAPSYTSLRNSAIHL